MIRGAGGDRKEKVRDIDPAEALFRRLLRDRESDLRAIRFAIFDKFRVVVDLELEHRAGRDFAREARRKHIGVFAREIRSEHGPAIAGLTAGPIASIRLCAAVVDNGRVRLEIPHLSVGVTT